MSVENVLEKLGDDMYYHCAWHQELYFDEAKTKTMGKLYLADMGVDDFKLVKFSSGICKECVTYLKKDLIERELLEK